jgi:hypothetical protein
MRGPGAPRGGVPGRGGWTRHLHTVRSFEKLTVGGMNLLDLDLIGILDEMLPARFGGGPTHY